MDTQVTQKPVVFYTGEPEFISYGDEFGRLAIVNALNHPRLGAGVVHTSKVLEYNDDTGVFVTLNTIYKPSSMEFADEDICRSDGC